jgi:hypothetical protein
VTETPDRPEADDPRVLALAKARQQMAHDNPFNVVCPPWDGLTEQEQHLSLLDARNYLRAALKAGLVPAAVSAGLAPATDRAAVRRDRYAAPLFALMRQNGWDGERTEPVVREMDLVLDAVLAVADAEQAVLPASLDRAAVLREAAAALAAKYGPSNRAAAELLRMAAEARGATGRPDGRGICPVCGRDYKLTGAGLLPRHTGHVPDHRADDGMSCRGVGEKPIAELRRMADETPPATQEPHSCPNCEGVDPDTCLMNPNRPADETPQDGTQTDEQPTETGYGPSAEELAGHLAAQRISVLQGAFRILGWRLGFELVDAVPAVVAQPDEEQTS